MTAREQHLMHIHQAKDQLKTAKGERRARELRKYIYRMQRLLKMYDRYHREAAKG